jgi:hypothetical protein
MLTGRHETRNPVETAAAATRDLDTRLDRDQYNRVVKQLVEDV